MALNPNHTFEDLGDIKCAIAEKNCTKERADFLKALLELNGFTVVVAESPAPKPAKAAPAPKPAETPEGESAPLVEPIAETPAPEPVKTYTVGVTDVAFSPTNAIFNRELKNQAGQIVTPNYWYQKKPVANEGGWYWKK